MSERAERCERCRFWEQSPPEPEGYCHRYPPTVFLMDDLDTVECFPVTLSTVWCGEFKPRDEF